MLQFDPIKLNAILALPLHFFFPKYLFLECLKADIFINTANCKINPEYDKLYIVFLSTGKAMRVFFLIEIQCNRVNSTYCLLAVLLFLERFQSQLTDVTNTQKLE